MMLRRLTLALAVPLAGLVACSLPVDERVTPIARDELPPDIANTTTTSTTTTTTTTIPNTIDPGATSPTTTTTTTTEVPARTAPVDLYYTIGFSDSMALLTRELPEETTIQQVIAQLEDPPDDVAGFGLRTAVRRGMVADIVVERGTATIDLDSLTVERMNDATLGRAIGQLVLTVTSFRVPDAGNIGRVKFESDGEGFPVFVPAGGGTSEPDEELAFEDFAPLIASSSTPSTTLAGATTTTRPDDPELDNDS